MFALTTGMTPTTSGGTHNAMTKKSRKCFDFDGVDEYVNTTITGNELNVNNAFTIAAWVRFDDGQSGSNQLICGAETGNDNKMYLGIGSTGLVAFFMTGQTGYNLGSSGSLSNNDTGWVFMAGKWDSTVPNAYASLNGATWNNAISGAIGTFDCTDNIWLGCKNNDGAYDDGMNGKISSIMFFNKALSQAELDDLYSGGRFGEIHPKYAGAASSLLAWYRMGDETSDTHTTLIDISGNSNEGTVAAMESGDLKIDSPDGPMLGL